MVISFVGLTNITPSPGTEEVAIRVEVEEVVAEAEVEVGKAEVV
jgi:hypothetical protein